MPALLPEPLTWVQVGCCKQAYEPTQKKKQNEWKAIQEFNHGSPKRPSIRTLGNRIGPRGWMHSGPWRALSI